MLPAVPQEESSPSRRDAPSSPERSRPPEELISRGYEELRSCYVRCMERLDSVLGPEPQAQHSEGIVEERDLAAQPCAGFTEPPPPRLLVRESSKVLPTNSAPLPPPPRMSAAAAAEAAINGARVGSSAPAPSMYALQRAASAELPRTLSQVSASVSQVAALGVPGSSLVATRFAVPRLDMRKVHDKSLRQSNRTTALQ